jgi:hypothetical protein
MKAEEWRKSGTGSEYMLRVKLRNGGSLRSRIGPGTPVPD